MCAIYKSSKKSAAMPVRTSRIHNAVKILAYSTYKEIDILLDKQGQLDGI